MTSAKHGAFPSLKMASLNFLMTLLKQQDGKQELPSTGIPRMMAPLSSVIATENPLEIGLDTQNSRHWKILKKEIVQRLSLNAIAYTGNSELNEEWLKGYRQAIKDIQRQLDGFELFN
jgi:hypothetical protein